MPGPENYDLNNGYLWGKKDITPNNYVEITPEQQAEIDKAKAAKDNEALAKGLNGDNVKDLSKGVSVQRTEPVRTDIGNGGTKITHPDGTVEFVFDYAKGYNGAPQLFDKDTKVTYLNAPAPEVISPGVNQDKIDEWGRQVSHGQIRHLGRGLNALGNVATFAFGVGIFAKAFKGANTVVQFFNSAVKGGGTLIGAAALASCSKEEPMSPPDAGASVTFLRKDAADYVVNYLNTHDTIVNVQTGEEIPICKETDDGVKFTYGYDYDAKTDAVSPYIDFGNGLKLPIFMDPLPDLTDGNIIDYINIIGDELATSDGVNYDFKLEDDKAQVEFDNGLTHNIGDDITLNPDGTTAKLSAMLASVNLAQPEQNSTKIALELETGEGSYGNGTPGFAMNIVTPARLKDITSGNPTVKGNVGGYDFEGQTKQAQSGTLQLEVNGKIISNAQDGIIIKNANGDEVYMQAEKGFDLQSQWDEPGQDYNLFDGVVVYVKEAGSDVFKEKFIMSKFDDAHTDIGIIDRENGAIVQNYPSTMTAFDTYGAIEAEDYYNDKEDNLNDAYTTADSNFRYLNQFEAQANADVDIY